MKTTFLLQYSALLSAFGQMATALPEPENGNESVSGTAIFKSTMFNSTSEENYWEEEACYLQVTDLAGFTGVMGPWAGACSENHLEDSFYTVGNNGTEITIDPQAGTMTFTTSGSENYQCQATGFDEGQGCTSWEQLPSTPASTPGSTRSIEAIDGIQPPTCLSGSYTVKDKGNEQPVVWHLHKQISHRISCPSPKQRCSVHQSDTESVQVDFSASIVPDEWISAGFDVTRTVTSGQGEGCSIKGKKGPGASVTCMYKVIPHTAYNARNLQVQKCPPGAIGTPYHRLGPVFRFRSPHKKDVYSFRCAYGTKMCHEKPGAHYWTKG